MSRLISKFLNDDSGATAIEYCLIASGIGLVIIAAVNGAGAALNATFVTVSTSLK
jgi:pilus assembly protein Flp/PilA